MTDETRAELRLDLPQIEGVEFRHVDGFDGYSVGDDGSVWSCHWQVDNQRREWRPKKPRPKKNPRLLPYLQVHMRRSEDGRQVTRLVHRVVLETFVGPCPPGHESRHIDRCVSNNRLTNLCWGTKLENAADKRQHGTIVAGERSYNAKLTNDTVRSIRYRRSQGERIKDIAASIGVHVETVSRVLSGKRWVHVAEGCDE